MAMTDLIEQIDSADFDISTINTVDLKKALAKSIEITAKHLALLGKIWVELENRGEDLSHLKTGLTRYLPMIGSGKLDPSVVIKFSGQQLLLREVALLPVSEQKTLIETGKVLLVRKTEDGYETDHVNLSSIHARHYPQIFNMGEIRSEDEQKEYLFRRDRRKPRKKTMRQARRVEFTGKQLIAGTTKIDSGDLINALSEASGKSTDEIMDFLGLETEKTT